MLKQLRNKKTAKKIWIVLAILILPAFILWGSGSVTRNNPEAAFSGKIFGKKISLLEFQESLAAVRNQAMIQFGDRFSDVQKNLDLESRAWERLIMLKEAQRRRIKVTDAEVVSTIQSYPFFQNNGVFNQHIYSQMLAYIFRAQARTFEEQTRQNQMIAKLFKEITAPVSLSDKEIRQEYKKANQELSTYYIAALPADFGQDILPSEEDLRAYFKQNSILFKQPLSFNVEYVEFSSDKIDKSLEEKIKKIYSRLNKKEPFEKVAKENNLNLKETGIFNESGPVPGIGWSPEVINLITQAKPGQYLMPLFIDNSYYILRLKEKKEPYIPEFATIKDKIKETLIKEKAKAIAKEKIESCLKSLKETPAAEIESIDFNKTAKMFSLKSETTSPFKFNSYIEGIGGSDIFWTTAGQLKENEFSDIIELPSGFYIIKLKSITPFNEQKLQADKAEFSQKILDQKKQEYFTKAILELKKQTQKRF